MITFSTVKIQKFKNSKFKNVHYLKESVKQSFPYILKTKKDIAKGLADLKSMKSEHVVAKIRAS